MRITNNLPALSAFHALNATNKSLQKTINALSTGLRINSSSDDAAGFAVSENMRSQTRGLDVALRNSQDGISLMQTAEGALGGINSMLQRMRELTVQASNDTLTSNDRQYIQLEIDELKKQIDQTASTTQFNKKRILDGSAGALWASSDSNLRARINGGLTYTDSFGQKVSSEGNYRIEITADPGEAQVQKSNIMPLAEYGIDVEIQKVTEPIIQTVYEVETVTEEVTEMVTELQRTVEKVRITETQTTPHIIRLNEGVDSINQTSGDGWEFKDGSLIITGDGTYDIRGTKGANATSSPNIVVKSGVFARIFLTDVNIDKTNTGNRSVKGQAGMEIESGATAKVWLAGNNSLKGGAGRACLEVPDGALLTLSSADGDGETTGTLTAVNSSNGAGIGGGGVPSNQGQSGEITISGGTIEARGGPGCAGIGGGDTSSYDGGGNITIAGGDITAWGGTSAAGIGSGYYPDYPQPLARTSNNTKITIGRMLVGDNCKIKAYGGSGSVSGAGIGGGAYSSAGNILIDKPLYDSGNIIAVSGGTGAEKIGHGTYGNEEEDNNVQYPEYISISWSDVPERPTITAEVEREEEREVYREVTVPVTRLITRQVERRVDRVIGERVIDEIPIIRGLNGDFVFKPKTLNELPTFYNSDGAFLISQPQTLTITQGDGKTANITLYANDVATKINDVIANIFGQAQYTDNPAKFCTIADGTQGTSEAAYSLEPIYCEEGYLSEYGPGLPEGTLIGYRVNSTMLVRSAMPGKSGEIYFSGDEELLRALGLNTIHESSETKYTASVYDAHTGKPKAVGVKADVPEFKSIIPPEIDIDTDPMAGIKSTWDEGSKRYVFSSGDKYTANLHLKDNSTTLQTGANAGEDFMIQFGDMSCNALELSRVNVASRESASRSMAVIDRAINHVSSQRAKIGANINGLEHVMTSLTETSANLTASESRIRDADMSKTMMDFVKLQILNQSGTSMLAQANQIPQSVLSLFGH